MGLNLCLTKNIKVDEIFNHEDDYSEYFNTNIRTVRDFGKGNRNSESTFIVQTDLFDDLNKLSVDGEQMLKVMTRVFRNKGDCSKRITSFEFFRQ